MSDSKFETKTTVFAREHEESKGEENMKSLQDFTDEQLLFELVTRNALGKGPTKTAYYGDDWLESIVGIGSDNVANIRLTQDDFDALFVLAKEGT